MINISDKRDDFNFPIISFPHLDSNISTTLACRAYISHLIRYARACTFYNATVFWVYYTIKDSSYLIFQQFSEDINALLKSILSVAYRWRNSIDHYILVQSW